MTAKKAPAVSPALPLAKTKVSAPAATKDKGSSTGSAALVKKGAAAVAAKPIAAPARAATAKAGLAKAAAAKTAPGDKKKLPEMPPDEDFADLESDAEVSGGEQGQGQAACA